MKTKLGSLKALTCGPPVGNLFENHCGFCVNQGTGIYSPDDPIHNCILN